MTLETAIPQLGDVLRVAVKAAGYRGHLEDIGLDKDLDDLALDAKGRQSSATELMQKVEDACCKALSADCGNDWAQVGRFAWFRTKDALQYLAQHVDASALAREQGQDLIRRQFTVPMLAGVLRLCLDSRQGPDPDLWWTSPFKAWVFFATGKAQITEIHLLESLANHLDADPRTIERWMSGEPTGKLVWPYRAKVQASLDKQGHQLSESDIDLLAGWLVLAVAFQSLPQAYRDAARRDFSLRNQEPWSLDDVVAAMNRQGFVQGSSSTRDAVVPLLNSIQRLFAVRPRDDSGIQLSLDNLQELIQQERTELQGAYQYIHDWLSARLAALEGEQDKALYLYASAVSSAWWIAGLNQHPILNEALVYAVGVGDKVAAENYWDKTFMLGLNKGPKRKLDKQELRRIAFDFEKKYYPQKAKDRIPPPTEFIVRDKEFSIGRKELANPNQKVKFAEGRTRRTPLMEAIRDGKLGDVKRLVEAGGDPNDFISESGEGPLSYAMRRACDAKDPIIMEFLLGLELLPETVNRPASTMRETPLKIAIEMASAPAVARLIALGADVEQACDYLPSALCYAMILLHGSLHKEDPTQELAYLSGRTPADVYDAKDGAVLDVDLTARRLRLHALRNATERNRLIFDEVTKYFSRPASDRRHVIQALLLGGADANRRYRVEPHHLAEWTPTLFAAQVGDLDVFKMLVEHPGKNGGDPNLVLMPPSSLERFDALWVAIDHGRHAIVSYLMGRETQSLQRKVGTGNS
jgi:ankyrin repeat protein